MCGQYTMAADKGRCEKAACSTASSTPCGEEHPTWAACPVAKSTPRGQHATRPVETAASSLCGQQIREINHSGKTVRPAGTSLGGIPSSLPADITQAPPASHLCVQPGTSDDEFERRRW
ncbi:hypothetical protein Dimus_030919, partial [Dionaea muscipula]